MKGDFTRDTFRRKKRYSGVRMQQGRVQTDADWNEQADITADRIETGTRHAAGRCGFPWHEAGFEIKAAGAGLEIGAGFGYVDGLLCWNPEAVALDRQPDFPHKAPLVRVGDKWVPFEEAPPGLYLAWLDVWTRHLTALDDPEIREVALGGPDTGTRTQTVWQVRLAQAPAGTTCASNVPDWNKLVAASTGSLNARARPEETPTNLCAVAPGAGYRRLENQLYRIEIHQGGELGTATFKWSRENGSIVTAWEKKENDNLTVASAGRDAELGFASGQWIELTDRDRDLLGETGTLVRLKSARGRVLEIDPATKIGPSVELADYRNQPRVRRWESQAALKVEVPAANGGWIALEDGVEVRFEAGTYRTGDFWYVPARTATGDVEWPRDAGQNPVARLAQGILHHTCRLATVTKTQAAAAAAAWKVESDCRPLFPPLTDLVSFYLRGGDGQEVNPDPLDRNQRVKLPATLVTAVTLGPYPLKGRTVRFTVTRGDGRLTGGGTARQVATGADGLASCEWELDGNLASQEVKAELLGPDGNPRHTPVFFRAALSEASRVSYDPKDCPPLQAAQVRTVQEAITELCKMDRGGGGCEVTVGEGGQFETIEKALEALKDKDLCLCLLPGEHKLAEGLEITGKTRQTPRHVSIHGCHRGARIVGENKPMVFLALASVELRNLKIEYTGVPDAIVFDNCDDVAVTSCEIASEADGGALMVIDQVDRARLVANSLRSFERTRFDRHHVLFAALPEVSELFSGRGTRAREARIGRAADALVARPRAELATTARGIRASLRNLANTLEPGEVEAAQGLLRVLVAGDQALDRAAVATALDNFFAANLSVPATALVFRDGRCEATLEDNQILGAVGLYGNPGRGSQATDPEEDRNLQNRETMQERMRAVELGPPAGMLRLRGNSLTRVLIAEELRKKVREWLIGGPKLQVPNPFHTIFMNENSVQGYGNLWIAHHVRMTSNDLGARNTSEPGLKIGLAIAVTAIDVGNSSWTNNAVLTNAATHRQANLGDLNPMISIVVA